MLKLRIKNMQRTILTPLFLLLLTNATLAGPLQLIDGPLFLSQSVPPALAITFDDSGSMAWGFMPDSRPHSSNIISYASSDYNAMYYNPDIVYTPPIKADGFAMDDSNFNSAIFDGLYRPSGNVGDFEPRINLSNRYRPLWVYAPDYAAGPGNYFGGTANGRRFASAGRNNTFNPAFYYRWNGAANATFGTKRFAGVGTTGNTYTLMQVTSVAERQNFANWYTYYNVRAKLGKTAMSQAFANFGPDFKIDWQQINRLRFNSTGSTNMQLFDGTQREDFYSWLFGVPSTGGTPLRRATRLAGQQFTKAGNSVNSSPYYDEQFSGELTCQQNFHIALSDGSWNGAEGITFNADRNAITLPAISDPDGGSPLIKSYNPGGFPDRVFRGDDSRTLADNAFAFWANDLRPDLDNNVPSFLGDMTESDGSTVVLDDGEYWWEDDELFWNPANDPATWQHVVNFNVGLGIEGGLDRETALPLLRSNDLTWPPVNTNQGRVDDVWHASVNSRGDYFSAGDPRELSVALFNVISAIIERTGRGSAGAVSSSVVSANALSFTTSFDSSDWSGSVIANRIESDGTNGDVIWDASCKLTGGACSSMSGDNVAATNSPSSRNIFTYVDGSKQQFTGSLSASAKSDILDSTFHEQTVLNGGNFTADDIIDYIRGDKSNEALSGGQFRTRTNLLGDIIHSSAIIVRGPSASFGDIWTPGTPEEIAASSGDAYLDYRSDNKNRNNIVLVGANDGMLHAFDAGITNPGSGGHELWAFIPSKLLEGLSEFASPTYKHDSYVDSAPVVGDARIANNWTTVALGGVRHGAKLFYALNLGTDPENEPDVLWEFSDDDDSDMGFTYSGGIITKIEVPNGGGVYTKWVAVVPNGYNSASHTSAMYVIDLESGALIHKWNTNIGSIAAPNGMGPPTSSDIAQSDPPGRIFGLKDDGSEYAYAGDLAGNLYRFDFKDILSGNTVPKIVYNGSYDRPITTAPRITVGAGITNAANKILINFGTGKYIELADRVISGAPDQYLFGLLDEDNDSVAEYTLNDSRIVLKTINQISPTERKFESFSNALRVGESWKMKLPTEGERLVIGIAKLSANLFGKTTLFVATIIPNGRDPCLPGGKSWLMFMDARSGTTTSVGSIFEGNVDGILISDLILGANILTTPGGNQSFIKIDTVNSNAGGGVIEAIEPVRTWRRRSWHRILF